jgi:hypothetical protein
MTACGGSTANQNAVPPVNTEPVNSAPVNAEKAPETEFVPLDPGKFSEGADPKGDVVFATRKQMTLPVWSLKVTSPSMPQVAMEMEHIAPDRWRFRQGNAGEVIVIGKKSYVNRGQKWEVVDQDLSASIGSYSKLVTEESIQKIKDVRKVREEQFKGKDVIVYEYVTKDPESDSNATTLVWIDKVTGLPLKIELTGEINGVKQTISSVYDYDKKVVIEAPKVE